MVKIDPAYSWKEDEDSTDSVEAAIDNLSKNTFDGDRFNVEDDGKSFNRPTISGGKHSVQEQRIRDYLMEWYEETPDEFDLDMSEFTIRVTGKMTKASGRYTHRGSGEDELKISLHLFKKSIERVEQTARHEAVHAWQYQEHGRGGHGPTFRRWLDEFDITVHAEDSARPPKYEILCPNCGVVGKKQRECKTTKKVHLYSCTECGSQDLSVRQNH